MVPIIVTISQFLFARSSDAVALKGHDLDECPSKMPCQRMLLQTPDFTRMHHKALVEVEGHDTEKETNLKKCQVLRANTKREPGYSVISYSIFANATGEIREVDSEGLMHNLELARQVYPDWTVRLYHDESFPEALLVKLISEGMESVNVTPCGLHKVGPGDGAMWRFLVADDESVGRYIIRDLDSLLTFRESEAVKQWIDSGLRYHVMRDHPEHNAKIMGGMWGGIPRFNFSAVMSVYHETEQRSLDKDTAKGDDQDWLERNVWPVMLEEGVMQHDSYHCDLFPVNSFAFPTKRTHRFEHSGAYYCCSAVEQGCCTMPLPPDTCNKTYR